MQAGFIGLGHMGAAMAQNLLRKGHSVSVYNRSRSKAEALEHAGAEVVASPAEAARSGIVHLMLADDAVTLAAIDGPEGVLAGLPAGGIVVNHATVSLEATRRMAETVTAHGSRFVAAPVFGRPDAAEAAKLFIVAAGPTDAIDQIEPLLQAVGQQIVRFGEDPSHAALVKISGNFMLQSAIETLAEALALVRRHGVDPQQWLDFMTSSLFGAPIYRTYGAAMVENRFEPAGFAIPLALKDTRLAIGAAEAANLPLPLGDLIRDRFLIALGRGWDTLDQAALGRLAAEHGGIA